MLGAGGAAFEYWNLRRFYMRNFETQKDGEDLKALYETYKQQAEELQQTLARMEQLSKKREEQKLQQQVTSEPNKKE